jgi:hypothetical protein
MKTSMKAEIIFGSLLVIALVGFFIYEFSHSNQTQTTYYASKSSSTGISALFPKNPNGQLTATSTRTTLPSAPTYFPYQGYQGGSSAFQGGSYAPYAPYPPSGGVSGQSPSPTILTTLGYIPSDASPSFGKVRIGNFGQGNGILTFILYGNEPGNEKINITGWQIKANNGGIFIPQVVNSYDPSGSQTNSDLVLGLGDQVTFYSTASPVGYNLRLNKCIGYMDTQNKFQPPLPNDCPSARIPQVQSFSAQCQDYVASLYSCQIPDVSRAQLSNYDDACRQYLFTLNYAGCYARYSSIPGFFEPFWRVYTGTNFANSRHDRIVLLDRQGKVVDGYVY